MFSNKVIQEDVENEDKMSKSGSSDSNSNSYKIIRSRNKITLDLLPSIKHNSDNGKFTDPENQNFSNKSELSMPNNLLLHNSLMDPNGNYLTLNVNRHKDKAQSNCKH